MMAQGRAKAGGEVGKNGEFYKGGSFLPSTELPKHYAAGHKKASRKVLIEPGVMSEVPEGMQAIFPIISSFVDIINAGAVCMAERFNSQEHPCWQHYGPYTRVVDLIEKYNEGARFVKRGK